MTELYKSSYHWRDISRQDKSDPAILEEKDALYEDATIGAEPYRKELKIQNGA